MTLALWILGYLVIGFVVAVVAQRYDPTDPVEEGVVWLAICLWPAAVALFVFRSVRITPVVNWCARRLP